jgi:hypothetical protein
LIDPENPDISPVVYDNLGSGTSNGIEFLVKKRAGDHWSGWLSYTYSKAKADGNSPSDIITPGVSRYVDWDQRHTTALVLNYANKGWSYSLITEYGSGLPYGDENSQRNPSHLVCDLNISREVKNSWLPDGVINLGIANLFNAHTVLDRQLQYDEFGNPLDWEPSSRVTPRFFNLSYTRQF